MAGSLPWVVRSERERLVNIFNQKVVAPFGIKTSARLPAIPVARLLPFKNGRPLTFANRVVLGWEKHIHFRWFHTCAEDLEPLVFFLVIFYYRIHSPVTGWRSMTFNECFGLAVRLLFIYSFIFSISIFYEQFIYVTMAYQPSWVI